MLQVIFSFCINKVQPEKLKFMKEYPLRVFPAPDPTDIIYENLEVSVFISFRENFVLSFTR